MIPWSIGDQISKVTLLNPMPPLTMSQVDAWCSKSTCLMPRIVTFFIGLFCNLKKNGIKIYIFYRKSGKRKKKHLLLGRWDRPWWSVGYLVVWRRFHKRNIWQPVHLPIQWWQVQWFRRWRWKRRQKQRQTSWWFRLKVCYFTSKTLESTEYTLHDDPVFIWIDRWDFLLCLSNLNGCANVFSL